MVSAFEGNKAETKTMLPVIEVFMAAHDPRPFQDHDVRPRIAKGRFMDRPAHRVASVTSVRPDRRRAQIAK